MSTFTWGSKFFFLLLLFLPFVYRFYRRSYFAVALRYSAINLIKSEKTLKEKLFWLLPFFRSLALLFFILALARPQFGTHSTEVLSEGVDILLTIDTSGSMKALDFKKDNEPVDRLEAIKKVVDDFIQKRPYDRIGMVVFGSEAYTQCPLTLDKDILRSFLGWIHIGIAGDGTAIGNALATSVKRLQNQMTKSRVVILLTDGRNNAGEIAPQMAAQIAKEMGIKVYTIGVGTNGQVPYPQDTPFGQRIVYAQLDLDEDTLREVAEITGGKYFRATDTDELEQIYSTIDSLEKTEIKTKEYHDYEERFLPLLVLGILFLLLEIILQKTVFLRLP